MTIHFNRNQQTPFQSRLIAVLPKQMMSLQSSLRLQKRSLRKSVNAILNSVPVNSVENQSRSVVEKVLALPEMGASHSVSCYLSMPTGEVVTSSLVNSILRQPGKQLFVPKILDKDGVMDFFEIFSEDDLASLPSGMWGIKEPQTHWQGRLRATGLSKTSPNGLDVILLPGVAFDRSFARLGHGKGYYDRFLSTYTAKGNPKPLLIGLSLREQLLESESIPMGEFDWRADILITPDEVLYNPARDTSREVQ